MTTPYLSWEPDTGLDGAWQGIVSVALNQPLPTDPVTLEVTLNRDATGLDAAAVEIVGGRRITTMPYTVSFPSPRRIDVVFDSHGDHSTYYVRLRHGGADPLHPFFAFAAFVFTIDCERGDCREPALQAPADRKPRPVVDLLAKDYEGLVRVLAERVRATNPSWGDLSPASLERVLLELVAHQGDLLSYMQDRVLQEAFVESATQRYSLRQHALLLGHRIFEGRAAETTFAFDEVATAGFVPRDVSIRMRAASGEPSVVFHTIERVFVRPENNASKLKFAAWPGAHRAELPVGAREALLWGADAKLVVGQRLALVPSNAATQIVTLVEVEQRHEPGWVETPGDPSSTASADLIRIVWDPPLSARLAPWIEPVSIHANLVEARHGDYRRAIVPELEIAAAADARGAAIVRLDRFNSTIVPARPSTATGPQLGLLRALRLPDGPVLFTESAQGSVPELELIVGGEAWSCQDHLFGSTGFDRHYVAGRTEDGGLWLEFGDGVRGAAIDVTRLGEQAWRPARLLELHYRVGDPVAGNCARHAVEEIIGVEPSSGAGAAELAALGVALQVTNVRPGVLGQAARTRAALRVDIPASIRSGTKLRAVTLTDYADAARQVRGVARAAAKSLGGVFNTVVILVDPEGGTTLDDRLQAEVHAHIDKLRMAGREHFVRAPDYVPLEVELVVCPIIGWARHELREVILAALRPGADLRRGYFHPDRLSFDDDLALSDLLAEVQRVPGVRSVVASRFRRRDRPGAAVVPRILLGPTEVPRLDADPNYPENGTLIVRVVGLDVDESAFRTTHGGAP